MPVVNLFELPQTQTCRWDGEGMCLGATAFTADDMQSDVAGVGMTIVPAGSSVGSHAHDDEEEIHLIVDGKGFADVDGERRLCEKGDVIHVRPGADHAIMNHQPRDLVIFSLAVKIRPESAAEAE